MANLVTRAGDNNIWSYGTCTQIRVALEKGNARTHTLTDKKMSFKQLDQCLRLSVALLVLLWSVTESVIRSIEGELRPQKKNLTSGQSSTFGPALSRNWISGNECTGPLYP